MPSNIFDPIDQGTRPVIDRWHHEVHQGEVYGWHYENRALSSGVSAYIHIKTGDAYFHNEIDFHVIGGCLTVQFYENSTVATAGTAIAANNRHRYYSTSTPLATLQYDPTVTTVGTTLISARYILGASGVVSEAVTAFAGDAERIFNKSEDYVIKLTPVGDVQVTVDGLFYEESTL